MCVCLSGLGFSIRSSSEAEIRHVGVFWCPLPEFFTRKLPISSKWPEVAGKLPKMDVFGVKPGCFSVQNLFKITKVVCLEVSHRYKSHWPVNPFRSRRISLPNVSTPPERLKKQAAPAELRGLPHPAHSAQLVSVSRQDSPRSPFGAVPRTITTPRSIVRTTRIGAFHAFRSLRYAPSRSEDA